MAAFTLSLKKHQWLVNPYVSVGPRPYEVTKVGELPLVATIKLKLWDGIDDNSSVESPLTKHHSGTNTGIFHDGRLY